MDFRLGREGPSHNLVPAAIVETDLSLDVVTVAVPIVGVAMLATAIMAVDPLTVARPMAGDPDHLVIPLPILRAMTVVWPITKFDSDSLRLDGAPESEAGSGDRCEQQCFLVHKSDSDGNGEKTGKIEKGESLKAERVKEGRDKVASGAVA